MCQGRYRNQDKAARKPIRCRKLNKYFLVTLSLFLLLGVAGGATLAYIIAGSETVENSFTPGVVQCTVAEKKDTYFVANTGTVDEFIRVAVVVNWESAEGIYAFAPEYTLNSSENWTLVETNGCEYYYYNSKVAPDQIVEFGKIVNTSEIEGFDLSIEILAEAIQAEGMGVSSAQEAWAMVMPATGN